MCYEERYYSEWTRRATQKREEPKPAAEPTRPEVAPAPKPARTPAEETETASAVVGKLRIVDFDPKAELFRDAGSTFRTDATSRPVANPIVASGSLEQSNVSVVERVAELSDVNQGFQALLKAVSVLMNDVDRGAITELGRR